MATKLWAMEENDLATADELEVGVEEGEVADVQNETDEGAADVTGDAENIEAGVDASAELEQVEELVAETVEQGEGLDPVAAEAIRLAVSVIASKVGANPKSVYSLYASENFQSVSSRKGNSVHALEGVQEFLKDLWKKIKAALTKMWTKVKTFWAKHISNVGRVKKALDSMKAKVKASSGKIDGKAYLDKAPSGLISAFPGKGDLTYKVVETYLNGVKLLAEKPGMVSNALLNKTGGKLTDWVTAVETAVSTTATGDKFTLIGGDELTIKYDADTTEGTVKLELEREPIGDSEDDRGMPVADKSNLVSLLDAALTSIKVTLELQKKAEKSAQAVNKFMADLETEITNTNQSAGQSGGNASQQGTAAQDTRTKMRMGYKLSAFDAKISSVAAAENVKACKAVLSYVATCLKQYK